MQKVLKIRSYRSSFATSPVISPSAASGRSEILEHDLLAEGERASGRDRARATVRLERGGVTDVRQDGVLQGADRTQRSRRIASRERIESFAGERGDGKAPRPGTSPRPGTPDRPCWRRRSSARRSRPRSLCRAPRARRHGCARRRAPGRPGRPRRRPRGPGGRPRPRSRRPAGRTPAVSIDRDGNAVEIDRLLERVARRPGDGETIARSRPEQTVEDATIFRRWSRRTAPRARLLSRCARAGPRRGAPCADARASSDAARETACREVRLGLVGELDRRPRRARRDRSGLPRAARAAAPAPRPAARTRRAPDRAVRAAIRSRTASARARSRRPRRRAR